MDEPNSECAHDIMVIRGFFTFQLPDLNIIDLFFSQITNEDSDLLEEVEIPSMVSNKEKK